MAHVLIMPKQGNTVESCIIVEWKAKEGDTVSVDTPVCEVETDKATVEVPAGATGTVLKILCQEGDDVPVFQPIMVIGKAGEDYSEALKAATPEAAEAAPAPQAPAPAQTKVPVAEPAAAPVAPVPEAVSAPVSAAPAMTAATVPLPVHAESEAGWQPVSPRARSLAQAEALPLAGIAGSGPAGRIIEADVKAALAGRPPLTAAAKDALRAEGAVPAGIPAQGTGIGGRVTLADIHSGASTPAAASSAIPATLAVADEYVDTPIKGIRKVIADRMMGSLATTAQFTLNASANATHLQAFRGRLKEAGEAAGFGKITINDLILFAVSRVLPSFQYMNGVKLEGVIRNYRNVHLGVAVDTPRGLMVPVIRNANLKSLAQIAAEARQLATACINGTISPDQLTGSTFTISNLGSTGIESFTPVINAPELAILGVCGIQPKPVMVDEDAYDIQPHLGFSLTIDHAAVDGAPAARFLKALCDAVADIDIWIAR
ncbi:MAG: 2-oxo acid dehydrogenase subunit E2 [Spirochaetaceae bacterium]|nr:2-oxo acid dehydrogenase subunit E2 [Spirochaetaceae bacterium]